MPFKWRDDKEDELVDKLEHFMSTFPSLTIYLNNFSSFPPRVIFINVDKTLALNDFYLALKRFCKRELNLFNADYKEQPFHPHLTLAFRDLKKPNYQRAWNEFEQKKYKADFIVDKIALLKHSGKIWEVFREFRLQPESALKGK
jgi:2'-5' RNA ligase